MPAHTHFVLEPRPYPSRVTLVIPVYNEAAVLPLLRNRLVSFADSLPTQLEIFVVNDGSSDESLELLMKWAEEDPRVKVLNFARNFGHQIAVTAGLDYASGDVVIVIDADLQDPPEVIHEMLFQYCRGYDVVYGRRTARKGETRFKRLTAWMFYRIMRAVIHPDLPADAGDFRLISSRCLIALAQMRETHRFLRGMISWVGFPQTAVEYERDPRAAGVTKYPLRRMLRFAWTAAVAFSPAPLRISFAFAVVLAIIAFTQAANAIMRTIFGLYTVPGWTSLMVVLCLIGSAILVSIGVLGEYVARIFEENKHRPLYVVADAINVSSQQKEKAKSASTGVTP
jgi:glycosyltransferase involved in cell wall biosynthesis